MHRLGLIPAASLALTLVLPDVALARRAGTEAPAGAPTTPPPAAAPPVTAPAPAATPVAPGPTPWAATAPVAAPPAPTPAPSTVVVNVPPPRPVGPPPPPSRLKGGNEMIIAGGVSLGVFYFFTSLAGAVAIDKARDGHRDSITGAHSIDKRKLNYGRGMLIPIAGPFIAMGYTDSAKQRWAAVFTGSVQAAGAVLVLAGMVRNARLRRWERMQIGAGYAPGGAGVSISGRF